MISVAVCTCNRARKLEHLLDSLTRMAVPAGLAWEVVVVDNNSTDDTAGVVGGFAERAAFPVRRGFERRQGIASARNRAMSIASGDIVAFTDDDCRVAPDWLAVLAREFAQDPDLILLGGRVELFDPRHRPVTIRTGRERLDLTGDMRALQTLIGCNLAFRRGAGEKVGGFDLRFGAGSGVVPSGDDLDFVYRMLRLDKHAVYSPDLLVYHDHGRVSQDQVDALQKRYLQGRGAFYAKYTLAGDRKIARMAYWEIRNLLSQSLHAEGRREALRTLSWLLSGAAVHCWK